MKSGKKLFPLTLTLILAGCASQQNNLDEPRMGDLLAEKKANDAAANHTASRFVDERLELAREVLAQGRYGEAVGLYEEVLTVAPQNAAAHAGLNQAARSQRRNRLYLDASDAWSNNDAATAQMHLNALLAEDPTHSEARDLRERIAEATRDSLHLSPSLNNSLQEKISLSFKEAPIEQVFEILSQTSEVNFLFDREVRRDQTVTIFLRETTVADAVKLILMTNQLEQLVVDENTVIIHPATSAKQREYQQLTIKAFQLIHGNAQNIANMLKSLLKARDIVIDERLNMLVMRDGAETIRLAEQLVALHDIPAPEVMLEVTVLEIKRSRLQELGIRWPDQMTLSPLASAGNTLTLDDLLNLNSGRVGVGIAPLTLNANKQLGDANILANPRIRAQNNETANILIGERVPNITATSTATGFVSESVQYVDVGLKLDVQPTVFPNDEIAIKVALEVSNIIRQISTSSGSVVFQIGTRTANTTLRLKDGENQVLAGLITDEFRNNSQAVPGLNDIPIIGRLFSSERDESQKTEVVLSITPRLIRNVRPPALERSKFGSGTEAAPQAFSRERGGKVLIPRPQLRELPTSTNTTRAYVEERSAITPPPPSEPEATSQTTPESNTEAANGSQGAPDIILTGPGAARAGETFSIAVSLENADLVSIPLQINFDPNILELINVVEGKYFGMQGYEEFTYRIDRELGAVYVHAAGLHSSDGGKEPNIINASFRAKKATVSTQLDVASNSAKNHDGDLVQLQRSKALKLGIEDEG